MQVCSWLASSTAVKCCTYHTEGADKLLGRLDPSADNVGDEVGRDTNDDNHGDDLHDADQQKGLAQRSSTVAWDRHVDW